MRTDWPRARVFVGPTISHNDARKHLDVEYAAPIARDDLPRALEDGIAVIGIIDAAFIQTYSANPTEILQCLTRGVVIFGAASAGALRAVETEAFGMRGIGAIFQLYRSGFEAEDELAVGYDPESGRAMSIAMINARYALRRAAEAGVLDQGSHDRLVDLAKGIYFPERTWERIWMKADGDVDDDVLNRLKVFVHAGEDDLDLKRQDAIACLNVMHDYLDRCARRRTGLRSEAPDTRVDR